MLLTTRKSLMNTGFIELKEVLRVFFITKDNPDGTKETVKTIYGPIEEAEEEFNKIIEEQCVEYHMTKVLDHWRVIRLFDEYGKQLLQES